MKHIFLTHDRDTTHLYLTETSLKSSQLRELDHIALPFDSRKIHKMDGSLPIIDHETYEQTILETVQKCRNFFENYIVERLEKLHRFHNFQLSFKKIKVALVMIRACDQYKEDRDLQNFKRSFQNVFQQAINLQFVGGKKYEYSHNLKYTPTSHKYPAGLLGECVLRVADAFYHQQLMKMRQQDTLWKKDAETSTYDDKGLGTGLVFLSTR